MSDLQKAYSAMEAKWHRIVGCCGNYWEGAHLAEYLLSLFTYKRFCDICEYQITDGLDRLFLDDCEVESVMDDICEFSYPLVARWGYVLEQTGKVSALRQAIEVINYRNFKKIPYGNNTIPEFLINMREETWAEEVLHSWMHSMQKIQLSPPHVSEEEWLDFSRWLRSKCR